MRRRRWARPCSRSTEISWPPPIRPRRTRPTATPPLTRGPLPAARAWPASPKPTASRPSGGGNGGPGWLARDVQDGVGVLEGPGQDIDRLCRGQDDKVDFAAAGLVPDLLHHRQCAISTGANHQPAAPPGDVLSDRQRGVPIGAAEPFGRGLAALADLSAVDDQ